MLQTQHIKQLPSARWPNRSGVASLVIMSLGVVISVVVHDYLQARLQQALQAELTLDSPAAGSFNVWASSEAPDAPEVRAYWWIYNITNPEEVLAGGKPHVAEVGPLEYRQHWQRFNWSWDADSDGDVIRFKQRDWYTPVNEATVQLERAYVTALNFPLLGALNRTDAATLIASLPAFAKYKQPAALFVTRTAAEVLWGWQNDPLLTALHTFSPSLPTYFPGVSGSVNDSSLSAADAAHQYHRMYTGKHTANLARNYLEYDGMGEVMCCEYGLCGDTGSGGNPVLPWTTDEAQAVGGSGGDQFHTGIDPAQALRLATYQYGAYRHWPLDLYPGDDGSYVVEDITLLRFGVKPTELGNMSINPKDAASYNTLGPSGLLNMTACAWGLQLYLSSPHFLYGSSDLAANLSNYSAAGPDPSADPGADPSLGKYSSYLGIEPVTGTTLDFHWRVQSNVLVQPVSTTDEAFGQPFTFFPDVSYTYIPVSWSDRFGSIGPGDAAVFRQEVYGALNMAAAARWGGAALSIASLLAAGAFFYVGARRQRALETARASGVVLLPRRGGGLARGLLRFTAAADGGGDAGGSEEEEAPSAGYYRQLVSPPTGSGSRSRSHRGGRLPDQPLLHAFIDEDDVEEWRRREEAREHEGEEEDRDEEASEAEAEDRRHAALSINR